MERTERSLSGDITIEDLLIWIKEHIYRRGFWGKLTIQFREGNPVSIVELDETRKITPKKN